MIRTVIIDRSKWLSSEVKKILHHSVLHDSETGLQCCLGQYCEQSGIPVDAIAYRAMPSDLAIYYRDQVAEALFVGNDFSWFSWDDSALAKEIQETNDGVGDKQDLTIAEREQLLTELFSKLDIKLEFVGDHTIAVQKALDYMSSLSDNLS